MCLYFYSQCKVCNNIDMQLLYKELGETPLACIERYRTSQKISPKIPLTYAGRLDPMAEGLLILLEGEECKQKEKYTSLDKVYEFEILVGFSTDTYDLLGLVTDQSLLHLDVDKFTDILKSFSGSQIQKYPLYSSKTYNGKQLFKYGKSKDKIDIPEHEVSIYSLSYINLYSITKEVLEEKIHKKISLVLGDFRQKEIQQKWHDLFEKTSQKEFQVFSCQINCSAGTYVRQLVFDIGRSIGVPCTTFSIKRIQVGSYSVSDL